VAACNGGTPSPTGWQPVPGASPNTVWSTGSGDAEQTYRYEQRDFAGTLQELATEQARAVVASNKGIHFDGSDTFGSCPGQAAVATFAAPEHRITIVGLSVTGGKAVLVTYDRPANVAMDPEVAQAFAKALCNI
jgi:hypothetical protein